MTQVQGPIWPKQSSRSARVALCETEKRREGSQNEHERKQDAERRTSLPFGQVADVDLVSKVASSEQTASLGHTSRRSVVRVARTDVVGRVGRVQDLRRWRRSLNLRNLLLLLLRRLLRRLRRRVLLLLQVLSNLGRQATTELGSRTLLGRRRGHDGRRPRNRRGCGGSLGRRSRCLSCCRCLLGGGRESERLGNLGGRRVGHGLKRSREDLDGGSVRAGGHEN